MKFEIIGPAPSASGKFTIIEPDMEAKRAELMAKRDALDASLENNTLGGMAAGVGKALDDNVRLAANGISLGFLDKALGPEARAATNAARDRQGYTGMASEALGSMALPMGAAKAGLTATNLPKVGGMLGLPLDGAAVGALNAYGNDKDVATGAGIGAVGGLIGQGIGAGINRAFTKKPVIPTAEELKKAGQAAFERSKAEGVIFKPEAVDRLRGDVYKDFADFGFHPQNQPGASVAYGELERLAQGGNVAMEGLHTARKVAQGGFNPTNPSNNALIGKVTERIDDFAANASPEDVLAGNPQAAAAALKEGQNYWSRFRKLEKVQELMDRAGLNAGSTGSGGNVENATRQQLKRILTDKKMMRGFTADEKAAVKQAVLGTPVQNALRLAGKMSPQGNGLMLWLQGAGSVAAPQVTIPAMLAGYGAKKTAESMTRGKADIVQKLIASGGSKEALKGINSLSPEAQKRIEAVIRALMVSGTTAAATTQ